MIEKKFSFIFDFKNKEGKRLLSLSDLMDYRKKDSDLEIFVTTPDTQTHSKFISRRTLTRIVKLGLVCIEEDQMVYEMRPR